MNTCIHCGTEFIGRHERPNKYCSNECHIEHNRKMPVQKTCGVCGKEFTGHENRQYCSLKCVHDSMRLSEKPCAKCGKIFAPEKSDSKYCSWNCMCQDRSDRSGTPPDPVPGAFWLALTKGKFALIDEEDREKIALYTWHAHEGRSTWYARSRKTVDGVRYVVHLHHVVMGLPLGSDEMVDHKDQNGLNCRKENLRSATESKNRMNTMKKTGQTKYKGVALLANGRFKAAIGYNCHYKYLGNFETAEEAARAYDAEARKVHGANGRYNFPEPGELPAR